MELIRSIFPTIENTEKDAQTCTKHYELWNKLRTPILFGARYKKNVCRFSFIVVFVFPFEVVYIQHHT